MAEVRLLAPDDWQDYRDIRLRALADSPDAFASTLARESTFDEGDWRLRLSQRVVVVLTDGEPVSVGGLFVDPDGQAWLWGMWTDPGHRRRGHARRVMAAVVPEDRSVRLDVNLANSAARAAYERYGFVSTGELEPLRPGSGQRVELMVRAR